MMIAIVNGAPNRVANSSSGFLHPRHITELNQLFRFLKLHLEIKGRLVQVNHFKEAYLKIFKKPKPKFLISYFMLKLEIPRFTQIGPLNVTYLRRNGTLTALKWNRLILIWMLMETNQF